MNSDRENCFKRIMDGSDRSVRAGAARLLAACAEPFYAGAMRARNAMYDAEIFKTHDLKRPAISVGNITTGGTGKTPVVRWIAEQILAMGKQPAILMRGYKRDARGISDEQTLLENALKDVPVIANPDRIAGAAEALSRGAGIDLFILDDAMQHRRAARNIEIVLINALEPFGYGHVFPRGLLREPIAGLRRADVFILTHADEAESQLPAIESEIRRYNRAAPIFRIDYRLAGFRAGDGSMNELSLKDRRYFAFCGIGSPESFFPQLRRLGGTCVGEKAFPDHHRYNDAEVNAIRSEANADVVVVTEKDWVKLANLQAIGDTRVPVWRAELGLHFRDGNDKKLLGLIQSRLAEVPPVPSPGTPGEG
jgi:tetraacyldisaccharide 4'-kinase